MTGQGSVRQVGRTLQSVTSQLGIRRSASRSFIPVGLLIVMLAASPFAGRAVADSGVGTTSCDSSWHLIAQYDDSFLWQELFPGLRSASWSGRVQLQEKYDSNCYVIGVRIVYTGPVGGGTLALTGDLFVSFTVQYPAAFTSYAGVATNAYGDLTSWSPNAGTGIGYRVETHFNINSRGADEYFVQGLGLSATVTGVKMTFKLPTSLVGKTVYAQIHVGQDLCTCSATATPIPGETPPAPPGFDFALAVNPSSGDVLPGSSITAGVTATLISGTANAVSFSATGLPPDMTASFAPPGCLPTCTSTMTLTTSPTTPSGPYAIAVQATDGSISHSATHALVVDAPPPPADVWGVYIHAHEDDWQLFESPNTYHDYQAGDHLLFIYASAGDAGQGPDRWQAREEATKSSVQVITGPGFVGNSGSVTICYSIPTQTCHNLWQWTLDRTVSIYMRLPDGGNMGGGFPSTGYQSLGKLRDGNITSITAVDSSTTYTSWEDFYRTLAAIVDAYAPADATTNVHGPDFDRARQTSQGDICTGCIDHADHLAVGDAVYAMTVGLGNPWTRSFFIDYPLGFADPRYPINLGSADYDVKKRLFMAYNDAQKAITGEDEYAQMPWFWENIFQRDYYRTI